MKKVLQIRYGEYLAHVNTDSLVTSYGIEDAIDLNELSWVEISNVFGTLHKQGFKKMKVIEVAE